MLRRGMPGTELHMARKRGQRLGEPFAPGAEWGLDLCRQVHESTPM